MADVHPKEVRSYNMSRIRGRDTKPELIVRSYLHRQGLRFRIHRKELPGKPDLVFPRFRAVVFVHGCYWHRHENCKYATIPDNNREDWLKKFRGNVERDIKNQKVLESMGWRVLVIWECETRAEAHLGKLAQDIRGE